MPLSDLNLTWPLRALRNRETRRPYKVFLFFGRLDFREDLRNQLAERLLDQLAGGNVRLPVDVHLAAYLLEFELFDCLDWFVQASFDLIDDSPNFVV